MAAQWLSRNPDPTQRYALIDREKLNEMCGARSNEQLRQLHHHWIEQAVRENEMQRHPKWTEAIAIGSEGFVEQMKQKLGVRGTGHKTVQEGCHHVLREPESAYTVHFAPEKGGLSLGNTVYFDINSGESTC